MAGLDAVDLNLFRILHVVLSEGSVTAAARRLHVTQSAVSNSLARLRALVGDPLLVRHGRTLVPTPRAQQLAPQLAAALDRLQAVAGSGAPFEASSSLREFTLACTDDAALAPVPRLATLFAQRLPNARLSVIPIEHAQGGDAMARGDVDLVVGPLASLPHGLQSERLFNDETVCLVWREHPDVGARVSLDDFLLMLHVRVAWPGAPTADPVDRALGRRRKTRRVALTVPQYLMAGSCLVGTSWIATLPRRVARALAAFLPLRVLPAPLSLPQVATAQAWHLRTQSDPAAQFFRQLVRQAAHGAGR